jgi:3-phosphoinositide dependent protein kinase-1
MGGDLSLSQSLGALRIANPDDSPLNSLEGTGSSHLTSMFPSTSISPLEVLPTDTTYNVTKSSSGSTPTVNDLSSSYGSSPSQMTLRILDPVSQQQKNRTSVFTSQEAQPIPQHLHAPLGGMARPVSGFYTQPFANNSSSTTPTTREDSYRIRTDS